jgi:potassium channel subfamily K
MHLTKTSPTSNSTSVAPEPNFNKNDATTLPSSPTRETYSLIDAVFDVTSYWEFSACILHFVIGMLFYTLYTKFSALQAAYFIIVTLTTIGFGDISPNDDESRIFTIFYIIFGVLFVLPRVAGYFVAIVQTALSYVYENTRLRLYSRVKSYTIILVVIIFVQLVGAAIYLVQYEKLPIISSLYWLTYTSFGIGYGDIPLSGNSYMVFAIIFIILIVFTIGAALVVAEETYYEHLSDLEKQKIASRKLTNDMILSMDRDGDGVDKLEFLVSVLVQLNIVDEKRDIDPWLNLFDKYDVDSNGRLNHDDLLILAQNEQKTEDNLSTLPLPVEVALDIEGNIGDGKHNMECLKEGSREIES